MATRSVLVAMLIMMAQCQSAAATMFKNEEFSDAGCATQTKMEWLEVDQCMGDSPIFFKISCSTGNVVSTIYSDSKCTTKASETMLTQYASYLKGYTNGVADNGPGCTEYAEAYMKSTCASPARTDAYSIYTDAACTTAYNGKDPSSGLTSVGECQYSTNDDGTAYSNEQKYLSGGNFTTVFYLGKTCSGTPVSTHVHGPPDCFDGGQDDNGVQKYYKLSQYTPPSNDASASCLPQSLMTAAISIALSALRFST